MHRTTIMLPDELKRRAEALAEVTGESLSEFIRQAIESQLLRREGRDPVFWDDDVVFAGKSKDLSSETDKHLNQLFDEEMARWRQGLSSSMQARSSPDTSKATTGTGKLSKAGKRSKRKVALS